MTSKQSNQPFVIVFAGAGASKAVSSSNYPTTVEFFKSLPPVITGNELFKIVMDYLKSRPEIKVVDIEVVLWILQELRDQLKAMHSNQYLLGWLLQAGRIEKLRGAEPRANTTIESAGHALHIANDLISNINIEVYRLYGSEPDPNDLMDNWITLFKGLSELNARTELVTTNYDLVIEASLTLADKLCPLKVDHGWRGQVIRKLELPLWSAMPSMDGSGLLTKLHGSINWTRRGGDVHISDTIYTGSHTQHAIIYPGFKGRPQDEPFLSIHSYFANCVKLVDAVIFIGFAFRDEFVNDLFDRGLRENARLITINPAEPPSLTWLERRRVFHIQDTFQRDSIHQALAHLPQG